MDQLYNQIERDINHLVDEWLQTDYLQAKDLFVIGCSTSEIVGKPIGTGGSEKVAAILFQALNRLQDKREIHLVFQSCEHINRALVIEQEVQRALKLDQVAVVPVPEAGGAMAAYAYKHLQEAVVVENIQADAGIDIGGTLIGMHLKHVAVPLQTSQRNVGNARIIAARTRPKLIGGPRAQHGAYNKELHRTRKLL